MRLREIKPAPEPKVQEISVKLNLAMCLLWPEARSQSCYFRLFNYIDKDKSGLLSYYEVLRMTRDLLKIPESKLKEAELLEVWRWIDTDCDGVIQTGEFLRLVRKGWSAFLAEQERLAQECKGKDLMRRPNWRPTNDIPWDRPVWPDVIMGLDERRRIVVEAAKNQVIDRTHRLEALAKRSEAQIEAWTASCRRCRRRRGHTASSRACPRPDPSAGADRSPRPAAAKSVTLMPTRLGAGAARRGL